MSITSLCTAHNAPDKRNTKREPSENMKRAPCIQASGSLNIDEYCGHVLHCSCMSSELKVESGISCHSSTCFSATSPVNESVYEN